MAELARLVEYNPDGKRGLLNRRDPSRDPRIPARMSDLFHSGAAREHTCARGRRLEPIHSDPNVYTIRHFLSPRELDRLDEILTSRRRAFKQSHTDSDDTALILGAERTSSSLALPKGSDATLRAIEARAAELVGLPPDHVEPLQIVHYADGAKFDCHHDLGAMEVKRRRTEGAKAEQHEEKDTIWHEHEGEVTVRSPAGARRLVTIFVYLNTLPEGVGHTRFPYIGLSVRPRSGMALVFCNVKLSGQPDARLCHEACPVPSGSVKFGCNIWLTDVTMQAHAVEAVPIRKRPAGRTPGLLAPLLQIEHDDFPPPHPLALVSVCFRRRVGARGCDGRVASYSARRGFRLEYEGREAEDMEMEELLKLPLAQPCALVGRRVSKHFPGHGVFCGVIEAYSEEHGFSVRYSDGDSEDMPPAQVLRCLCPEKATTKRRKAAHREARPTEESERSPTAALPASRALVGRRVRKLFRRYGFFEGVVTSYDRHTGFHIKYDDGDEEDVGLAELCTILSKPEIPSGKKS
ncbi:hypothetical protein AB1Y20_007604 [Prymnesium parvum]|uniref:Prolyl 4-hydroxylase alpha subunit domain-containing protein n=1 Tax=Prymnesium parvum TaxID=97485 RepID=A0AB34IVG8_PRYPA